MTKAAGGGTVSNNSEAEGRVIATSSVVFSDGSLIELVASANDGKPALLFFNGKRVRIAPQIHHLGQLYQPLKLDMSLRQALRLPGAAKTYGSTKALFGGVASLFDRYVGLSASEATLATAWTATTWFSDCLPSPPTLAVSGPDMSHAITLFRLLGCLCRRALILGEFSRSSFRSLPMSLRPTLLVNQPYPSPRIASLLRDSNYRGLFVPGNGGIILDLVCSKAIFTAMADLPEQCNDQALHIALPPAHSELPPLDEREQDSIANRFQPRWLMYRLLHANKIRQSRAAACALTFPTLELARSLMTCVPDQPEFAQALVPLLQSQEQDVLARRSCDASSAIVEVLWATLHEPSREATVSQVADLTNALLRSRGEIREYSAEEVGWRLRDLGIPRHRGRNSMVVQFSREISRRVHRLARGFAIQPLKCNPKSCADCREPQIVAPNKIVEVSWEL
jgi:hypothetical protein